MTSNKNIPIKSTREFENVHDQKFNQKMHMNTLAALQKTRNSVAVYNASTDMFTSENNNSQFNNSVRSKSIIPHRQDVFGVKQNSIRATKFDFFQSIESESIKKFKGHQKLASGASLPFNVSSPFIHNARKDTEIIVGTSDGFYEPQMTNLKSYQNSPQGAAQRSSLLQKMENERSHDQMWTPSMFEESGQKFFIGPKVMGLNENSSQGIPLIYETNVSDKVSQLQKNPMMYRKYDPNFSITENIGVKAQMRDSKRMSGGLRATKFMSGFHTSKHQSLQPISLPLTPRGNPNGAALKNTKVNDDPKKFMQSLKYKDKGPLDIQASTVNKTIDHQSNEKDHFDLKQIARKARDKLLQDSQISLESDYAIYLRTFGVDPCLKLEQPDTNHFRKMKSKNSENIRQFSFKLEKTNDQVFDIIANQKEEFHQNMKVIDWQQKKQKEPVPDHLNIGFQDFCSVKKQYYKDQFLLEQKRRRLELQNTMQNKVIQIFDSNKIKASMTMAQPKAKKDPFGNLSSSYNSTKSLTQDNFERLPCIKMKNREVEPIHSYIENQINNNKEVMKQIDNDMPESIQLNREQNHHDNVQIIAYNQKIAQDAKDYVQILNTLFITKVGQRQPRGLVCDQVSKALLEARVDSGLKNEEDLFPLEPELHIHVQGKLHNKVKHRIQEGLTKLQEARLMELIRNTDAQVIFQEDAVFQFLMRCAYQQVPFFSILQSLAGKRLVIIGQKYVTPQIWSSLTEAVQHLERPIRHFFIQDTIIDDEQFPLLLDILQKREELTCVTFVKITFGHNAIRSIFNLLDLNTSVSSLRLVDCKFQHGLNIDDFLEELTQDRIPLQKLALIAMQLNDRHLPMIMKMVGLNKLKELDLAWNQFTTTRLCKLFNFLQVENKLVSLNVSWNSLITKTEKEGNFMVDSLNEYMKRTSKLQHIDLSNTYLSEKAMYYVIKRLAKSTCIQSVHFSGQREQISEKTAQFIQRILNPMDLRKDPDFSNSKKMGPAPLQACLHSETFVNDSQMDEMILNYNRNYLKDHLKTSGANQGFHTQTPVKRYVLQRILGHPEIDSYEKFESQVTLKAIIKKDKLFAQYDTKDQISINKHFSRWFESDQCWLCNKFRYFIPVWLQSEIKDIKTSLTAIQDNELRTYLARNKKIYSKCIKGEPYIIGSCTNFRLQKMKKVIEFLLKLDPNSNHVLERCVNDEKKIQNYYRAQMLLMIEKYLGCKPFFDRILTRLVDQDDCMYVHNDFVKPGRHSYYIFVPDGRDGFTYKNHFITFVKPRAEDLVPRPIPRAKTDDEGGLKKAKSRFPSLINKEWKYSNEHNLESPMLKEFEKWRLDDLSPSELQSVKTIFLEQRVYFFGLYRQISIESESYPSINQNDIVSTFIACKIINSNDKKIVENSDDDDIIVELSESKLLQTITRVVKKATSDNAIIKVSKSQFFEIILRTAMMKFEESVAVPENIIFLIDRFLSYNIPPAEAKKDNTFVEQEVSDGRVNDILVANQVMLQEIFDIYSNQNPLKVFSEAEAQRLLKNVCPDLSPTQIQQFFRRSLMSTSKKNTIFAEFLVLVCLVANNVVIKSSRPKKGGMVADLVEVMLFELVSPYSGSVEIPESLDNDLAYTMSSNTSYKFNVSQEKDFSEFMYISSSDSVDSDVNLQDVHKQINQDSDSGLQTDSDA